MDDSETFHGQSTKENYRADIQDSLNQQTIYKSYEYFDDVSYGNSDKAGLLIKKSGDVYFFQCDGPKNKETLQKLLEWRRSGQSDEVGHKGGGNLRNIYGFKSKRTSIYMKKGDTINRCCTHPNRIYDLSRKPEISEADFRDRVDTSEYITVPETIDNSELPTWYPTICEEILKEFKIEPNYLIRMELTDIPAEYSILDRWTEYTHQLGAKQYEFPIFVKNEVLGFDKPSQIKGIDLVGFRLREREVKVQIYICSKTDIFCLKYNGEFIDLNGGRITEATHKLHWGDITMFIANKDYITQQINEYNKGITYKLKAEDMYGAFFRINEKLTNYRALTLGGVLPQGKNNKIINWIKNSNYFRMIITPDKDTCQDPRIFNALINTNTIKALTEFLDKGPYKEIIRKTVEIYRGKKPEKTRTMSSPKIKNEGKQHIGGYYIGYIGKGLWKHGIVETMSKFEARMSAHRRESIVRVREFTQQTITQETFTVFLKLSNVPDPALFEQRAKKLLDKHRAEVTLFEAKNGSRDREYFLCKGDYITQCIIPEIKAII